MFWLVDIGGAVRDGTITAEAGAELERRARSDMLAYAVNTALFTGVLMTIAGTAFLLQDRLALSVLGVLLTLFGVVLRVRGGLSLALIANAIMAIGSAMAVIAIISLVIEEGGAPLLPLTILGVTAAIAGALLRRRWPERLGFAGGWLVVLGLAAHIVGILASDGRPELAWIAFHHIALLTIAAGVWLDIRFLTAISIIPLAIAMSAGTYYTHASYTIVIREATLTVLQTGIIAALCLLVDRMTTDRFGRHGRALLPLALIWLNMAFWVGSLWGDEVTLRLFAPEADDVLFTVPSGVFVAGWAALILGFGAWGVLSGRRGPLNMAVVFGGIHLYTQYFELLGARPLTFVGAGVLAILFAWLLWSFNRRREGAFPAGPAEPLT